MTTPEELAELLEFGRVIYVDDSGHAAPANMSPYVPYVEDHSSHDVTLDGVPYRDAPTWSPLVGYTGQYGYRGAVMHSSEYIGGALALDILSTPGLYVSVIVMAQSDSDDIEPDFAGWAILRRSA